MRAHVDPALGAAQELGQLLVDDADYDLSRCQRIEDFLTDGPLFDFLYEVFDHTEIHIGLEQRHAHFAHRCIDILLRELAMSAQLLERLLEAFGKRIEQYAYLCIMIYSGRPLSNGSSRPNISSMCSAVAASSSPFRAFMSP